MSKQPASDQKIRSEGVDLIILDIDGGVHLRNCLESVARQTRLPNCVILWDNGSLQPVTERVAPSAYPFPLTIRRSDVNLGFTGGVNRAMKLVSSQLVALVNNDVVLDESWIESLRSTLERDAVLGAVQSIIHTADGSIDGEGIDISSGRFVQSAHRLRPGGERPAAWGVSATAAMFRTEALEKSAIDGHVLHPAFFAYYEDVELNARLHQAGWKTMVLDRPLATHEGSLTSPRLGTLADRLRIRNRYFVRRMHPDVGRYRALLGEDVRRCGRLILGGRLFDAARVLAAVSEGLTAPVLPFEKN